MLYLSQEYAFYLFALANTFSNSPETSRESIQSPESSPKENKSLDTREITEASKEFIEGVGEVVDSVENAEVVDGEVGESAGEDKKKGPQGSMKKGQATTQVVKKDDAAPPSIEIMQIQIATQVKNEIRVLEREMRSLQSGSKFNPMKLNATVSRIRNLRDILANLAHVAADVVKDWWMEFVKTSR